jgi:alcohol dehydrogenase YqhD (iron-dependent ADH family)
LAQVTAKAGTVTYEALDQWHFVLAAYGLGVGATLALVVWSWMTMRRAERRRDRSRDK